MRIEAFSSYQTSPKRKFGILRLHIISQRICMECWQVHPFTEPNGPLDGCFQVRRTRTIADQVNGPLICLTKNRDYLSAYGMIGFDCGEQQQSYSQLKKSD